MARRGDASHLVLMLSGAALYNRYPLVYFDTGGYLKGSRLGVRSYFYHAFIVPAHLTHTLWTVVLVQSLLVAYVLRLVLREVFAIASRLEFLVIIALLCVLSSLPWYAGFLMPDIFTPVMVLGIFLLAFCFERLSRWEQCFIIPLTFGAAIEHYSNPPIALGLLSVGLIVRMALRRRAPDALPHLVMTAVVIGAGIVALVISNYVKLGLATYSPGGYAFGLARLVGDGPAVEYLRDHCATRKYAACAYLDRMPMTSNQFLWGRDSLFKRFGFGGERKEGLEIVAGTIEEHPLWVLRDAIVDTLLQLGREQTGDGLESYANGPYPTDAVRSLYPNEFEAYMDSRENRNELAEMPRLERLHLGLSRSAFSIAS